MKLRCSLYARPVIVRGQHCAEAWLSRRSDRAATRQGSRQSRPGRYPTAEPSWSPSAAALSTGTPFGWPRAAAGRGGPGGADAGRAFVSVSTSSASGRRPVSGADVQSPRESVHATGVQCPVRASERPASRCPLWASRCPLWASGVRVPASAVSDRGEVVEGGGGQAAACWDGRGRRARPPGPRPARRNRDRGCAGRAGSGEASAWTWPS
jgi:hypothetical protein